MTITELISHLSKFDPETRIMMQDRAIILISLDIKEIKEIMFCSDGNSEKIVQLIPEF